MKIVKITEADLVKIASINPGVVDLVKKMGQVGQNTTLEKQFGIDIQLVIESTNTPEQPNPSTPNTIIDYKMQQLYCGCQYYWSKLNADQFCSDARANGFTGVHCELMELVTTGSLADGQLSQINKLKPWADACRKYNLILYVSVWNSNDVLAPTATQKIIKDRFDNFKNIIGTNNVIIQPMSENDNKTNESLRTYARNYASTIWPKEQIMVYEGQPLNGSFITEFHSDTGASKINNSSALFVTDNSNQKFDQIPNEQFILLAHKHIKSGRSFSIYGFHKTPDWATWKLISKEFKPGTNLPTTNTTDFNGITEYKGKSRPEWKETVKISNVRVEGGNIVWDEAPGQRDHWNKIVGNKTVNGETNLVIPVIKTAGCFDYLGVGQTRKITSNLNYKSASEPGFFHPWHPSKGEKIGFYICTINRDPNHFKMQERSNVVWFTWP